MTNHIQEVFIDKLIKSQSDAIIYLMNGIKLSGKIIGNAQNVIFLDSPIPQMIYKKCISTIVDAAP